MSGWTKGPWRVFHQSGVLSVMAGETTREVVHWSGFDSSHFPNQAVANAHLISQAPALYERLKTRVALCCPRTDQEQCEECIDDRAALAAAGGEA